MHYPVEKGFDLIGSDKIGYNRIGLYQIILGDKVFDYDQNGNMIKPRIWLNKECDSMGNNWLWGT